MLACLYSLLLAILILIVARFVPRSRTPEFMAPELYDENYDEKVDIYAFGMVGSFVESAINAKCHSVSCS